MWQEGVHGACMAGVMRGGGMCGSGGGQWGGGSGGMHGRGACIAGEIATAAGTTHPGMHSCFSLSLFLFQDNKRTNGFKKYFFKHAERSTWFSDVVGVNKIYNLSSSLFVIFCHYFGVVQFRNPVLNNGELSSFLNKIKDKHRKNGLRKYWSCFTRISTTCFRLQSATQ